MFLESVLEVTLPGKCAGHVLTCILQGPSLNYTRIGGWELEYLLFKSYYWSLQSAGMASARITMSY